MGCRSSAAAAASAVLILAAALLVAAARAGEWEAAHATFYGNLDPTESRQGACGYDDVFQQGYGEMTTALSTALFEDGLACGSCYEIRCHDEPQWCLPGGAAVTVTATNFCPPSDKPSDDGGWCNPPLKHFDLNLPAFLKIARYEAGIVPVQFRRVPCAKTGGVRFAMKGNQYWIAALVFNVGGGGDVRAVAVRGSGTGWIAMGRSWGEIWVVQGQPWLVGQEISFLVATGDGRAVLSYGVAPPGWQFGQTYEGNQF